MKTLLRSALLAALVGGFSSSAAAQTSGLKLSMQDGRVTIVARDVPLRQILQEWARVGRTNIVNADKLSGPPLTLELVNVPEQQALDTLLRTAAGYMAAPRAVSLAGASVYDRIMILPTSRPPAATAAAIAPPPFQRPQPQPMPDDDDEPVNMPMPMPNPAVPNPAAQSPAVGAFPGPVPGQPNPNANPNVPPGQQPQMPVLTSPRPGALPPPATTPNGVPNPYQPTIVRPGGGPGGPGGDNDRDRDDDGR